MSSKESIEQSDQPSARHDGTSSVRVAIVGFLVTLFALATMGLYWLFIRV